MDIENVFCADWSHEMYIYGIWQKRSYGIVKNLYLAKIKTFNKVCIER